MTSTLTSIQFGFVMAAIVLVSIAIVLWNNARKARRIRRRFNARVDVSDEDFAQATGVDLERRPVVVSVRAACAGLLEVPATKLYASDRLDNGIWDTIALENLSDVIDDGLKQELGLCVPEDRWEHMLDEGPFPAITVEELVRFVADSAVPCPPDASESGQ